MRKASDENRGDRKVADTKEKKQANRDKHESSDSWLWSLVWGEDETEGSYDGAYHAEPPAVPGENNGINCFGLAVYGGAYDADELRGVGGVGLVLAKQTESFRLGLDLGAGALPLTENSSLFTSVNGVGEVLLGGHFRLFLHDEKKAVRPFLQFKLTGRLLFWEYKHAIYTDVYDEYHHYIETQKIEGDQIWGVLPEIGAGARLYKNGRLEITACGGLGAGFYGPATAHSFENDVFETDVAVRAMVEILYVGDAGK